MARRRVRTPADQARLPAARGKDPIQLAITWPHRKLRRPGPQGGWRLDYAQLPGSGRFPRCATRRRRQCSRRPPDADATVRQGQHLVARVRPPYGALPRSEVMVNQFTQTQVLGQRDRKEQPSIGHQAAVVEGDLDAVGPRGHLPSIGVGCSSGRFPANGPGGFLSRKRHYPRSTGALSYPFSTPRHSYLRWIGA